MSKGEWCGWGKGRCVTMCIIVMTFVIMCVMMRITGAGDSSAGAHGVGAWRVGRGGRGLAGGVWRLQRGGRGVVVEAWRVERGGRGVAGWVWRGGWGVVDWVWRVRRDSGWSAAGGVWRVGQRRGG